MPNSKTKQWLWFVGLWVAGVVTLALIGGLLKLIL